jgi:hypothetical protein
MIDHRDLADRAFALSGLQPTPPNRTTPQVFAYLVRLLSLLPAAEQAGYVKAPPDGENVIALPDGTIVRTARVMTPDGQIYKVMNNVPNGDPQWVAEDVRPELYVPFTGAHAEPGEPGEPGSGEIDDRLKLLEDQVGTLLVRLEDKADKTRVEAINARLGAVDQAAVKYPMPDYVGRLFGLTITSRPK